MRPPPIAFDRCAMSSMGAPPRSACRDDSYDADGNGRSARSSALGEDSMSLCYAELPEAHLRSPVGRFEEPQNPEHPAWARYRLPSIPPHFW